MDQYYWLENILEQIRDSEKNAWEAISELETIMMFYNSKSMEQGSERDYQEDRLKYFIKIIDLKIQFALEYLQLPKFLEKYLAEFEKFSKNLNNIEIDGYGDYPFSPALEYQRDYITVINSFSSDNPRNKSIDLERILIGTPKIINDSKLNPANESEINRALYNFLIHPFPDTVREIPISKVTKTYKPDFGIKSLEAAIEYKFVDNEIDAKKVLGEIYEDIHGYEGSKDWKTFYAVIYMTEPFYTPDQIKAEFEMAKVNHSWKPILVTGKGKRRRKTKKKV